MSSSLPSMSTSMARVAHATPANETGLAHATARNLDDAPLHDTDIVRVVDRALVSAGLTNAEAARLMGIDKAHWSRQLNGSDNQHISFQRLVKSMPRAFWLKLLEQLAPDLGVVIAHPDLADRALHQLLLGVEAAVSYARQDRALRAGGMR
jgi:hypothetical protein